MVLSCGSLILRIFTPHLFVAALILPTRKVIYCVTYCYCLLLACYISPFSISRSILLSNSLSKISLPRFLKPFCQIGDQRLEHTLFGRRQCDPKLAWFTQCWEWVPHNRQIRRQEKGYCDRLLRQFTVLESNNIFWLWSPYWMALGMSCAFHAYLPLWAACHLYIIFYSHPTDIFPEERPVESCNAVSGVFQNTTTLLQQCISRCWKATCH